MPAGEFTCLLPCLSVFVSVIDDMKLGITFSFSFYDLRLGLFYFQNFLFLKFDQTNSFSLLNFFFKCHFVQSFCYDFDFSLFFFLSIIFLEH